MISKTNTKQIEFIKKFEDFLEQFYHDKIHDPTRTEKKHIVIDFSKIIMFDPKLGEYVLDNPEDAFKVFELASKQLNENLPETFFIRLKNVHKYCKVPINSIRSKHINKLISVEGMVKQKSDVRAQVLSAKFECPACANILNVIQLDERTFREPTKCGCGRKGKFILLNKEEIDVFSIAVEESTDLISGGTKLCQLKVLCKGGLTSTLIERTIYQGVRIEIVGVLTEFQQIGKGGKLTNRIDWFLDANYINVYDESFMNLKWTKKDEEKFEQLAERKDWLKALRKSIFYDIHGYEEECEGIILQMFSGVGKNRAGAKVRGTMHILLVGDPGCLGAGELIPLSDGSFKRIETFRNDLRYVLNPRYHSESSTGKTSMFWEYKNQKTKIITLATGKRITCSYEHPLHVYQKRKGYKINKTLWVKASDLKEGVFVRVVEEIKHTANKNKYVNLPDVTVGKQAKPCVVGVCNEDVACLTGYLLGDGYVDEPKTGSQKGGVWRFKLIVNEEELDLVPYFVNIIKKNFNVEPTINKRLNKNESYLEGRLIKRKQTLTTIAVHRKKLATIFRKRKDRGVYDFILSSNKFVTASFLKGLFEADGCIFVTNNKNRKQRGAIELKCSYERLRQDILVLLLRFGIRARINENCVVIKRTCDLKIFIEQIGFISEKKKTKSQDVMNALNRAGNLKIHKHKKLFEKIVSIEEGPIQDVYDITVEKYHKFISNGIISHNTSKSTLLKIAQKFNPKSMYVAGSAVSGVGLTASVTRDELLGGYTLDAGAIVLCNNGVLCIDELDKVDNEFKKALHEPLSESTVSIAKANIQATLVADTSVLAAANPKLGSYSDFDSVYSQIDLTPTLINRFDLVYPIRETALDENDDYDIAMKILSRRDIDENDVVELDKQFIKKYISFAKTITPEMPLKIQEFIAKKYKALKNLKRINNNQGQESIPVSGRNVDGFRRVIEAVARSRLHKIITREDAIIGYKKVIYSIQKVGIDPETGDVVEEFISGKQIRQKDLLARIISIIRNRYNKEKELISGDEIIAILQSEGIDDILKIEEAFFNLKKKGDILEPRVNKFKVI